MIARMLSPPGCSRTTVGAVGNAPVAVLLAVSIERPSHKVSRETRMSD
jgi:hypothetical protein